MFWDGEVASMRESELLAHIAARSADLSGRGVVVVGPGDDAAVLKFEGQTVVTVDHLIAGRHFDPLTTTIDQIARKAVARSVSDIAAMAGTPTSGLATGCLPEGYRHGDELFDRMAHWARSYGCPLVGGDIATSSGPLVLTVVVMGQAHASRGPVLRSEARAGDGVYLTGRIGGSLISGRHLSFEPRVAEGRWLADHLGAQLGAMIDLSDGLGRDGARVGRASGVRIELQASTLPLHGGVDEWRAAAGEGEDYELLFTVHERSDLPPKFPETGVGLTRIGRVIAGEGCVIVDEAGAALDVADLGWDHGA